MTHPHTPRWKLHLVPFEITAAAGCVDRQSVLVLFVRVVDMHLSMVTSQQDGIAVSLSRAYLYENITD